MTTESRLTPPIVDPDRLEKALSAEGGAAAAAPIIVEAPEPIDISQVFDGARLRRAALLDEIAEATDKRAEINANLKKDRLSLEEQAKRHRAAANRRIATARDELAKVDRLLAAEKPRTKKAK